MDVYLDVRRIVYHIDVLIAKLADNARHAASLHTDACAYWIDAIVVALHRHLSSLARHACHTADRDESVGHFRHFRFKKALEEDGGGAAEDDAGIVVLVVNTQHDGLNGLALAIGVARDLLALRQMELIALVVDEKHLALPHLIDFGAHHRSYLVLILVVERVVLKFENLRRQCLTEIQYGTTSKLAEVDLFAHVLAYLVVGFYLLSVAK